VRALGTLAAKFAHPLSIYLPVVTTLARLDHTNLSCRPRHAHDSEGL
jgi:hypothetical protein